MAQLPGASGPAARPSGRRAELRGAAVHAALQPYLDAAGTALRVVDVGGGTGGLAVTLAAQGHDVLVVDPSPDALAALERRTAEVDVTGRITAVQGDVAGLSGLVAAASFTHAAQGDPGQVDLVLLHSVLEVVDDPAAALHQVAAVLAPRGVASILVAQRGGAVLARGLAGHPVEALAILRSADGTTGEHDTVLRRFGPQELSDLAAAAGLVPRSLQGVRLVADLFTAPALEAPTVDRGAVEQLQALRELELELSDRPELLGVSTRLHLLAGRG